MVWGLRSWPLRGATVAAAVVEEEKEVGEHWNVCRGEEVGKGGGGCERLNVDRCCQNSHGLLQFYEQKATTADIHKLNCWTIFEEEMCCCWTFTNF